MGRRCIFTWQVLLCLFMFVPGARAVEIATSTPLGELMRHDDWSISHLAFSPNGRGLFSASSDHTVRLWYVATGKPVGDSIRFGDRGGCIAVSPDCKTMLVGIIRGRGTQPQDRFVRLWNVGARKEYGPPLEHWESDIHAAFSPDGRTLITGSWSPGFFRLWEVSSGKLVHFENPAPCETAVFSPDSRLFLTTGNGKARIWDAATGKLKREIVPPEEVRISRASFSPDNRTIISTGGDKVARFWEVATGKPLAQQLGKTNEIFLVMSAAYSPDGKTVATATYERVVQLWDVASGHSKGRSMRHNGMINHMLFSPDSSRLLTSGGDFDPSARIWNTTNGEPIGQVLWHDRDVTGLAFSPDGQTIATSSCDGAIRLWDGKNGRSLTKAPRESHRITDVALNSDGSAILTASWDGTAQLWDSQTCKRIGQSMRHDGPITKAAFSPDGKEIVTSSMDNTVRTWDATSGQARNVMRHEGAVRLFAQCADGTVLATFSGNDDQYSMRVNVWETSTGRARGETIRFEDNVCGLSVSPNGQMLAIAGLNKRLAIWQQKKGKWEAHGLQTGDIVASAIFTGDGHSVVTVGNQRFLQIWDATTFKLISPRAPYSPGGRFNEKVEICRDGRRLLIAGDSRFRVWDTTTLKPLSDWMQQKAMLNRAIFSPDGQKVLTNCMHLNGNDPPSDFTAQVWDVASQKPQFEPIKHDAPVVAALFSPDAKTILTASGDTVYFWDAKTGKATGQTIRNE